RGAARRSEGRFPAHLWKFRYLSRRALEAPPGEHVWDGAKQQLEVEPQRPVRSVEIVDLDHLVKGHARGAEHLPEAGHARREVEPPALPAVDAAVLVENERPRPDQAHLAAQ